jgi:hypothetical protein
MVAETGADTTFIYDDLNVVMDDDASTGIANALGIAEELLPIPFAKSSSTTSRPWGCRENGQEPHRSQTIDSNGGGGEDRTPDLGVMNPEMIYLRSVATVGDILLIQ